MVESVPPEYTLEQGRGGKEGRRRTTGRYDLREAPGAGTTVSFTNTFEPAGLAERLQAPLARAHLRRQNARALARLKALLEQGLQEQRDPQEVVT